MEQSNHKGGNITQDMKSSEDAPPNSAEAKAPSQLLSQWLSPAGFSATLLFLAVVFYFTALAYREEYFLQFGVDFALFPLEKQDYIYLGGKVTVLALAKFISKKEYVALFVVSLIAVGIFGSLLYFFAEWAQKRSPQFREKTPQWMKSSTFINAVVVLTSGVSIPLFFLFLPILVAIGLTVPGLIGGAFGRQAAADLRAAANPSCARWVKDAPCVELLDDGKAINRGVLLGGNKDRIAILNSNGVLVISLGTKTLKPVR